MKLKCPNDCSVTRFYTAQVVELRNYFNNNAGLLSSEEKLTPVSTGSVKAVDQTYICEKCGKVANKFVDVAVDMKDPANPGVIHKIPLIATDVRYTTLSDSVTDFIEAISVQHNIKRWHVERDFVEFRVID